MSALLVTQNNFLSKFRNYSSKFTEKHNKGLFGLVVALVTFGLERLLDKEVFKCPRIGYQIYGIAFFACPIVLLALLNLLTVPTSGNVHIWTLCENCFVKAYWRRGDVFSGFFSAVCVGLVAPAVWIFLSLMDGQHLVCWELGYQFGAKVSPSYLKHRGFQHLNASEYMERIDHAKAKSHVCGAIFLGGVAVLMFLVIILNRSCLKPFSPEKRFPGLYQFEKKEAFAAREEVSRLLNNSDEFDQFSGMASLFNFLIIRQEIVFLKEEKEGLEDERKVKEIEMEIEEFQRLEYVLKLWAECQKYEEEKKFKDLSDSSLNNAKDQYEKSKNHLLLEREKRASAAEKVIKRYESWKENTEEDEQAFTAGGIKHALYQSWLFGRLAEQRKLFDIDKVVESWKSHKNEIKRMIENLDAQLLHNGFTNNAELRGRVVASYIILQHKKQIVGCRHIQEVMRKFERIYPRAATSKPWQRYVNVKDLMYNYIIDEYAKELNNSLDGDNPIPLLSSHVKAWDHEKEEKWKKSLKKNHSSDVKAGRKEGGDEKNTPLI